MSPTAAAGIFLAVSAVSLVVQVTSLFRLLASGPGPAPAGAVAYGGLLRTVACRVVVAVLYVAVGASAVLVPGGAPLLVFTVFCGVQILWQVNSLADVRLKRRIRAAGDGRTR